MTRLAPATRHAFATLRQQPPDPPPAVIRLILETEAPAADWRAVLAAMHARIKGLRRALGAAYPAPAPIARRQRLFALVPIAAVAATATRADHAVYRPASGRINVAGLRETMVAPSVAALASHLPAPERHRP